MIFKTLFQSLIENPLLHILGAILLPISVWKLKQHLIKHRKLAIYSRDIYQVCTTEYLETSDSRRDFQSELDDLGQALNEYIRQTPIKSRRIRTKARTTVEACDDVAETWVINSVSGDLDTTGTHGTNNVGSALSEEVKATKDAARQLQWEVRFSFIMGPALNILYFFCDITLFRD